jgi:hypothetical protein
MATTITRGTRVEINSENHIFHGRAGTVTEIRTTTGTEYANGTDVWVRFDDDTTGFFCIEQIEEALPAHIKRRDLTATMYHPLSTPYAAGRAIQERARLDAKMAARNYYWSESDARYLSVPQD